MKIKRLELKQMKQNSQRKNGISVCNLDTLIWNWKMLILMHGLPALKLVVWLDLGLTGPQQSVLPQSICIKIS